MINCINCLNMVTRIDKKIAWCKMDRFEKNGELHRFKLNKQLKGYGHIKGFSSWKKERCSDFIDNSPFNLT
jgi:hypothetical protein